MDLLLAEDIGGGRPLVLRIRPGREPRGAGARPLGVSQRLSLDLWAPQAHSVQWNPSRIRCAIQNYRGSGEKRPTWLTTLPSS